jgi:hypothetical protein
MKSCNGRSFFLLTLAALARGREAQETRPQEMAAVPQPTAAVVQRAAFPSRCAFSMIIQGGRSSTAYQLPDGQIRVDTSSPTAAGASRFYMNGGVIRDAEGRGCIVTSPERQVQCNLNHPGDVASSEWGPLVLT